MGANDADARANDILPKRVADNLSVQVVEAGGRFIQQEHAWFFDERACDGGPLLLAAGKKCGPAIRKIAQAEQGKPAFSPLQCIFAGKARQRSRHLQISRHTCEGEQIQLLKDKTELLTLKSGVRRFFSSGREDAALVRNEVPGKDSQQRRLAATGCAFDQSDSRCELVREIVDDPIRFAAVAEEEIFADQRPASPRLLGRGRAKILHSERNRAHLMLETLRSRGTITARSVWPSISRRAPGKVEPTAAPQSLF